MFISKLSPRAPLYSTLGDVLLVLDATGLRQSVINSYGTVANGFCTQWMGISPGGAHEFTPGAVGTPGESSLLKFQDGYIEFPGYTVFGSSELSATYNALSYNSTVANLKWTIHMVLRIGQNAHPNAIYGLFGNNATSSANKGTQTSYDDRVSVPNSDGLTSNLTGSALNLILSSPDDLITPNVPFVYTEETDFSQAAGDRRKHYINGVLFAFSVTSPATTVQSGPTFQLGIGQAGNKIFPFRGWMSHIIIQTRIESSGVRNAFINSLLPFTNKSSSNYFYDVDESRVYSIYNTLATVGRYYFVQGLLQSPTDSNKIIKIYHNGNEHLYNADKRISQQRSTDLGRTWGAEETTYDEDAGGPYAVQDGEWGYSSDGRLHGISDWHTAIGTAGGTHKLLYHYSDNDGATYTTIDITSVLPSNGLLAFRAHGGIIEAEGYQFATLYMNTDEGDTTQYAQILLRKPVGSSTTWTAFTLQGPNATQHNESCVEYIGSSTLIGLSRDETTKEFHQFRVTNITGTPTRADDGAQTFGESFTNAAPPLLTSFNIKQNRVIAVWITNRDNLSSNVWRIRVIFTTPAALLAGGTSNWDLDTKFTVASDTQFLHYGRVCHTSGGFNAIGAFARDPFTTTENTLVTFQCPATNYFNTKAQLGL